MSIARSGEETEDDFEASSQLCRELEISVAETLATGRPVLTSLTADTSWLLSLSHPPGTISSPRRRFNVLIDPWFTGPQSDVHPYFSSQTHAIPSSVQSIAELNEVLKKPEQLFDRLAKRRGVRHASSPPETKPSPGECFIDLVIISHEFTDHCHRATLEEVDPNVPVLATEKAAKLIKSWGHFHSVTTMKPFTDGTDWRTTSIGSLPSWLGVSRLVTKDDALYYHSAVVICVHDPQSSDHAEGIIYTPHGVEASTFHSITSAKPPIRTLALLHGLNDVQIIPFKQLNLGAKNGFKAQRLLNAKYWVGTHDERKTPGGLIAPLLRITPVSLLDAAAGEVSDHAAFKTSTETPEKAVPAFVDVRNGESLLLA